MSDSVKRFEILSKLNEEFVQNIKILCVFGRTESDVIIVTKNDEIYGFGQNRNKILNQNNVNPSHELFIIKQLCNKEIINFSYGLNYILALTINSLIYYWPNDKQKENEFGIKIIDKLNNRRIVDICCGANHSLALSQSGEVFSWSYNTIGLIGSQSDVNESTPIQMKEFDGENVIAISCGSDHSLALTENGQVFSWGSNQFGQLGIEDMGESKKPILVKVDSNNNQSKPIMRIACGSHHSLLLSKSGDIYSFGRNDCFQLGLNNKLDRYSAVRIDNSNKFIDIASHFESKLSVALSDKNVYFVWGESGNEVISSPEEQAFNSFHDVFAFYLQITYRPIYLINDWVESFETIEQNGKYLREFNEFSLISNGNFGIVSKAMNRKDGKIYAIKKIPIKNDLIEDTFKELRIMYQLRSNYVVRFDSAWIEKNYIQIVDFTNTEIETMSSGHIVFDPYRPSLLHIQMELCSDTLKQTLSRIKQESNQKLNELLSPIDYFIASELFIEILESVNYLHKQNPQIIHRDLKPTNILITNGLNGRFVKIADFGLATLHKHDDESHSQLAGTLKYMAPEVLTTRKYDTKADIFSLGVISLELFHMDLNK
jgi:alpha-tubulin suppressor-like RCC1 family protein